jgi:hypothetical protein
MNYAVKIRPEVRMGGLAQDPDYVVTVWANDAEAARFVCCALDGDIVATMCLGDEAGQDAEWEWVKV